MITEIDKNTLDRITYFRERFAQMGYGQGHFIFACHAAFPIALTSDLLYQIWVNFKAFPNQEGDEQQINSLAVSDVLLSGLCRDTGQGIYEMDLPTRAHLLDLLEADPRFGAARQQELAAFLYQYTDRIAQKKHQPAFVEAQRWAALATLAPQLAADELQAVLAEKIKTGQNQDILRLRNLLESYANQEAGLERLLHYSKGLKAAIFEMDSSIIQQEMDLAEVRMLPVEASEAEADEEGVFHLPLPGELRDHIEIPDAEPLSLSEKAEQLIAEARRTGAKKLRLNELELETIPTGVFALEQLEVLDLFINKIKVIPPQIGQLKNLKELLISANPIERLPMELAQLTKLETLKLESGKLTAFPEVLLEIPSIEHVSLDYNNIPFLPKEIINLKNLRYLDLKGNEIINVPDDIIRDPKGGAFRQYFNDFIEADTTEPLRLLCGPLASNDPSIPRDLDFFEQRYAEDPQISLRTVYSWVELYKEVQQFKSSIYSIHFSSNVIGLPREQNDKRNIPISPSLLVQLLGILPNCDLVFLNGNDSIAHAQQLFQSGFQYTIGMEGQIDLQQASENVEAFYQDYFSTFRAKEAFDKYLANPIRARKGPTKKSKRPPIQQQQNQSSAPDPFNITSGSWRLYAPESLNLEIKNLYALLIGVEKADPESNVPELPSPINDVEKMRAYLEKTCTRENIPFNTQIFTNEQATYQNIVEAIQVHLGQADEDDGILFYFSGHSDREKVPVELQRHVGDKKMSTLVLYDSRIEGGRDLASIELQVLIHRLNEHCKNINVILDCSYAAGFGFKNNLSF